MRGAISLGRLAGIKIYVHWSFALLLLYVGSSSYGEGTTIWHVLIGIGFMLAVFGCVTLHELGHALAARRYGINTRDIILLPIGGVARLEDMPQRPLHEIVVAIAGPLVNVAIAAVLQVVLYFQAGYWVWELPREAFFSSFYLALLYMNLVLAAFNAIPAFPMDGGRVLRASLALLMERPLATRIAATIGQILAVCFAIYGFMKGQYGLILTGIFVFWAAAAEAYQVAQEAKRQESAENSDDDVAETDIRVSYLPKRADTQSKQPIDQLPRRAGQYAVGRIEASTGYVLTHRNELYRGEMTTETLQDVYMIFDDFESARRYAFDQVQRQENLKCWIEGLETEVILVFRA